MGMDLRRLSTCALLALCLVGCGHGGSTAPTEPGVQPGFLPALAVDSGGKPLEKGPAQSLGLTAAGEILVPVEGTSGTARRVRRDTRTPQERALLTKAQRRAKATGQLALTLEPGVTWTRVRELLSKCVSYQSGHCLVHVATDDGSGATHWTRFRASARPADARYGLRITLRGTQATPTTRVDGLGGAWPRARGCDGLLADSVGSWDEDAQTLWTRWLKELEQLVSAEEPRRLALRASRDVPAHAVLPLLANVQAAGLGEVDLGLYGHTAFVDVVDRALRWLAEHQNAEGHWDGDPTRAACGTKLLDSVPEREDAGQHAGRTGLALLAFLGAGYTNRGKHPFATSVSRGLRYLKRVQRPSGCFGPDDGSVPASAHSWAAWAMLEAYRSTGSPIFKGSSMRALEHLQKTPLPPAEDMLALLPTALTLHTARAINQDRERRGKPAELAVQASLLHDALLEARRVSSQRDDGVAAAAFFVRTVLDEGERKAPDLVRGLRVLSATIETRGAETDPVLAWCAGVASLHVGGDSFKRWTQAAGDPLVDAQRGGTHPCCHTGSWDPPAGMTLDGGRLAATAVLCLSFETLHRYSSGHVGR